MTIEGAAPAEPGTVRVRGAIRPPVKTKDVMPEYPRFALQAGVEGVVLLEAKLDREGRVVAARVVRSIPALDQAAIDAVMQWEVTPTFLNGRPTEVQMTVTVTFTLPSSRRLPSR